MDVQRIKSSRPEVLIAVRNVCRTQNDITCFSIDRPVADSELSSALIDHEDLVIRVNVQGRPFTHHVSSVTEKRNAVCKFFPSSKPRSACPGCSHSLADTFAGSIFDRIGMANVPFKQ